MNNHPNLMATATAIATSPVPSVVLRIPIPHWWSYSYTFFSITCSRLHPFFRTHWTDPETEKEYVLNEEPRSGDFVHELPVDMCGDWQSSRARLSFLVHVVDINPPNRTILASTGSVSVKQLDGTVVGLRHAGRKEIESLVRQLSQHGWEAEDEYFKELQAKKK